MSFRRVAVLNRGDAAMRFLRAARELAAGGGPSLEVVAVHTDPDRDAPYVRLADASVGLGPAMVPGAGGGLLPAYCHHDLVIERLVAAGCDAVWPGWGFVSEDPEFVERVESAGMVFIGPPAAAMRTLGDKIRAKELAERCGVPLAPWAPIDLSSSTESWCAAADQVGYPLMVKAANGGGGRGIRRVDSPAELGDAALINAVRSVVAEATAAFGPGDVFVERCIESARHVEVQFLVGVDGRATTFGVRDCSIQRRHQKVVEETPSPVLSPVEEALLTSSTAQLAEAAGYRGVGTAEFLFTPEGRTASFCEVNARLQVEHTVTEMVWGIDLVRAQIDVALGRAHEQSPGPRGWAVEARVVAEDPERGFAPSPGRVLVHRPAAGPNVRVDAGVRAGSDVPAEFDSMIAKVLAWGPTRERALATLRRAVREYEVLVEDGATNRGALLDLLGRTELQDATATTTWLESVADLGASSRRSGAFVALAVAAIELAASDRADRVARYFEGARSGVPTPDASATEPVEVELSLRGVVHRASVAHRGGARWTVGLAGSGLGSTPFRVEVAVERLDANAVVAQLGDRSVRVLVHRGEGGVAVDVEGTLHRIGLADLGIVRAHGPALLVGLSVKVGDRVRAGDRIGTVESMKTESALTAEVAGQVEALLVAPGAHVAAGQPVVVLRPSADGPVGDTTDGPTGDTADMERPSSRSAGAVDLPAELALVDLDVVHVVAAVVSGRECARSDLDAAIEALDERAAQLSGSQCEQLVGGLASFVAVEALFERNLLLLDDHSAAVSAESALHDLCRRLGAHPGGTTRAQVRPLAELEPLLAAVLGDPAAQWSDTPEVRRSLWRLASTRACAEIRERLVAAVVRALAAAARAGRLDPGALLAVLVDVERVAAGAFDSLVDTSAMVRSELGMSAGSVGPVDVTSVDPSSLASLARYVDVRFEVVSALTSTAGDAAVVRVESEVDPTDRRTVLAIDLTDVPEVLPSVDEQQVVAALELFEAGVGSLRRVRGVDAGAGDRDDWWAALHLVLHGARSADASALLELSHRFEPGTRGLALQDFTVALLPDEGADVVEFSLRRRGHARLEVDVADGLLTARPRSALDRRALTARRLGVVDPWELIGLLQGSVQGAELPHPSLAAGRFVEHDLVEHDLVEHDLDPVDGAIPAEGVDADRLVPVRRPPASHECSIIVGTMENPLPGRAEWAERILIAGDPLRSMGSLGEAECRRVIAALDLAEQRQVPVDWMALSSGARIAWDSGTENLDWTAAVLRRIVEFTSAGGVINVVVAGVNVGAQSYWNAEATMLMHTRGILVMTPTSSMVLTGRRALELSGSVGAQDEVGIGGHDRIMGPNGQAQYRADDLAGALAILLDHHALTHGERPRLTTSDPVDRDVCVEPYKGGDEGFATVGEIFDESTNPGRKRPFSVRSVMDAVVDRDATRLERWRTMADADGAVVWETRIGGRAVSMIGIESRPRPRHDDPPVDGPGEWAGGTLYPNSSKKVARALRAASGNRPVVVLANLSGFDGSPESLRRLQLEHGAEIARAVVEFDGRIVFVVIGRYHGGAYVVFSKRLHDGLVALAVEGSYASVIGGAPAAAVVLTRDVRERVADDATVRSARSSLDAATTPDERLRRVELLDAARSDATSRARGAVAAEFDAVHTVERAVRVGSLDAVIRASSLRPAIIAELGEHRDRPSPSDQVVARS